MKWWAWVLLLIAAVLWLERHDAALRAEARLLITQDSLTAAREQRAAADRARARADTLTRRALADLQTRMDWATLRKDSLEAVEAVARIELRATLNPQQRVFLDNVERNQKALTAVSDSLLVYALAQRDSALSGWARADSAATQWKALSSRWEEQATAWEQRARPGWLEQARRGLPWLAVGLVAGLLLVR